MGVTAMLGVSLFTRRLARILLTVLAGSVTINPALAATDGQPAYRVGPYVDRTTHGPTFLIGAGSNQGIVPGAVFRAHRPQPMASNPDSADAWIETGRLKAIQVAANHTVAVVVEDGTPLSRSLFPKFPGVMVGDWAKENLVEISRNVALTPTKTIGYFDLFVDPKAYPTSFELTEAGKAALEATAEQYAHLRLSILMIEGYTDAEGPADANQVESYQRALTVRQHLIDELGFDPARVVAIGYGESEQIGRPNVDGTLELNRRVVFKVKALPSEPH